MSNEDTAPVVKTYGPHRNPDGPGMGPRIHVLHTGAATAREALAIAAAWAQDAARDVTYVALADTSYVGEVFPGGTGIGYVDDDSDLPTGWRAWVPHRGQVAS